MKNLKKEDVINLSYKDITDLILQEEKGGLNTLELFTRIVNLLELPENTIDTNIAEYYTSLTTDKRFLLVDGLWDLRTRHTSDKVLTSIDEEDEDEEENSEEIDEDMLDEDDPDFDEEIIDDEGYEDDDDDGLSDLVMVDDDDMNMDNE